MPVSAAPVSPTILLQLRTVSSVVYSHHFFLFIFEYSSTVGILGAGTCLPLSTFELESKVLVRIPVGFMNPSYDHHSVDTVIPSTNCSGILLNQFLAFDPEIRGSCVGGWWKPGVLPDGATVRVTHGTRLSVIC